MTPQQDAPRSEDEAALETFFAAARGEDAAPRLALLSAILADAAEVQAARSATPAPVPRSAGPRLASFIEPLGGWRGVAALGACAALGFWLGVAGNLSIDGTTVTAGVASESAAEGVDAFFDYAALEQ